LTWGNPPKFVNVDKPKAKRVTPEQLASSNSEDGHQMAVFCWAASVLAQYPQLEWMHAIPNGGSRNISEATKLVATGTRGGVWDIFLPCVGEHYFGVNKQCMTRYAGLYIEMKAPPMRNRKNGGLTSEQIKFSEYAERAGYATKVCYTWLEARDAIVAYLEGKL
jgi:hypothetical protein